VTDVQRWTCSCPAYLISRFLLCKHLVRIVNETLPDDPRTDLHFFLNLRRQHYLPYYLIPGIHENTSQISDHVENSTTVQILGSGAQDDARANISAAGEENIGGRADSTNCGNVGQQGGARDEMMVEHEDEKTNEVEEAEHVSPHYCRVATSCFLIWELHCNTHITDRSSTPKLG
jgi:hypothetical protein